MKKLILLFQLLNIVFVFSSCSNSSSINSNRMVFEERRDESNYKLGYEFMTFPFRYVGTGESDDINSFKINNLQIRVPLDTVYSLYGKPIYERIVIDKEHGVKYKEIYFDGIKFVGNSYSDDKGFTLKRIYTLRKDYFTPDSLCCGMNLKQVQNIFPNLSLTCHANCETTGLLNIYSHKHGINLRIVFIENEVWTIIIDGMEG